jgi:hypothetical protein
LATSGGLLAAAEAPFRQENGTARKTMDSEPTAIVDEYFARIRARDSSVVDLFHDDARLVGLGAVKKGKPAIVEFYRGVIERAGPSPRLVGSLLASDTRVAAEIDIALPGGSKVHAIDLFEVEEGRIRSLTYFLASH